MKVLVTGGSGRIGSYVVEELLGGYEVTILDQKASQLHPDVPRIDVDLTSLDQTRNAAKGFDAIVHLAAIANPGFATWDKLISANTASTHNVLEAMKSNGIPRIVYASSESATGFGVRQIDYKPLYLPIDEEHPCRPHECYSLSKRFGEIMCEEYSRAFGIEAVALRFNWVWFDTDRRELSESIKRGYNKGRWLGAYVHAQDAAQACRLSLECALTGSPKYEAFNISAADHWLGTDYLTALHTLYGEDIPPIDEAYFSQKPERTLFTIEKAKRLLGYQPKHSWRDWA